MAAGASGPWASGVAQHAVGGQGAQAGDGGADPPAVRAQGPLGRHRQERHDRDGQHQEAQRGSTSTLPTWVPLRAVSAAGEKAAEGGPALDRSALEPESGRRWPAERPPATPRGGDGCRRSRAPPRHSRATKVRPPTRTINDAEASRRAASWARDSGANDSRATAPCRRNRSAPGPGPTVGPRRRRGGKNGEGQLPAHHVAVRTEEEPGQDVAPLPQAWAAAARRPCGRLRLNCGRPTADGPARSLQGHLGALHFHRKVVADEHPFGRCASVAP